MADFEKRKKDYRSFSTNSMTFKSFTLELKSWNPSGHDRLEQFTEASYFLAC